MTISTYEPPPTASLDPEAWKKWIAGFYRWLVSVSSTAITAAAVIPSGTVMFFYQAAAPTGWTQLTTQNDKALRVVSGAGGGTGGTHGLSSPPSTAHTHTGPSHTHTGPLHSHSYSGVIQHTHTYTTSTDSGHQHEESAGNVATFGSGGTYTRGTYGGSGSGTVDLTNAAGSHNHTGTTDNSGSASQNTSSDGTGTTGASGTGNTGSSSPTAFAPQYIDVILCSKD